MSANATLKQIQAAFTSISATPYCSGTFSLDPATSKLFYTKKGKAEFIDFAKAREEQLVALAEACQSATFGLKDKDVLDESYRKARKMDATEFSIQFSPMATGMIEAINETLHRGRLAGTGKSVRVELYKLNVYGPGSFFKAHVDTPRSENMFGSLVVVLPSVHEGGSLILRHQGKETVFDTAHVVNSQNTPHAAFVAFFSDVEHEVALVASGYRVTITYNLYLTGSNAANQAVGPELDTSTARQIEQTQGLLTNLLKDPSFLPEGGFLGFGLSHKYPFKPSSSNIRQIANRLKGSDAEVKRVCEALGLDVSLKALYFDDQPGDDNPCCLLDEFFSFYGHQVDEQQLIEYILDSEQARNPLIVYSHDMDFDDSDYAWAQEIGKPIVWLRPVTQTNSFNTSYVAYGNQATIALAYGDFCLVAEVAKAEDRVVQQSDSAK